MQSALSLRRPAPLCRRGVSAGARQARPLALRVNAIAVGDMLPSFELQTDDKSFLKSQDMVRDSGAIIFIYPKADTSGCTFQACGFRDNLATFNAAGYKVYGLSADKPEAQAAWKQAQAYNFSLLCDPEFKVLPALCGAAPGGKITRTHLVVGKGGKVLDVQLGVGSKDSVPAALDFVAKHKA